jgi:hypothetical protein
MITKDIIIKIKDIDIRELVLLLGLGLLGYGIYLDYGLGKCLITEGAILCSFGIYSFVRK